MFCQVYICWRKQFLKRTASEEDNLVCRACEHRDCWIEITGSEGCENSKDPKFHNVEGEKKERTWGRGGDVGGIFPKFSALV